MLSILDLKNWRKVWHLLGLKDTVLFSRETKSEFMVGKRVLWLL